MSKVKMQCTNCGNRIKTDHPEIVIRFCKGCGSKTEFTIFEKTKKPVVSRQKIFIVMCLHCGRVQAISKSCCWCGQRFNRRSEEETITDVILNILTGSSDRELGYLRVTVCHITGMPWWTAPKDSQYSDDPFLEHLKKQGSSSYQGQGQSMRSDDLRPVETTTSTSSIIRKRRF